MSVSSTTESAAAGTIDLDFDPVPIKPKPVESSTSLLTKQILEKGGNDKLKEELELIDEQQHLATIRKNVNQTPRKNLTPDQLQFEEDKKHNDILYTKLLNTLPLETVLYITRNPKMRKQLGFKGGKRKTRKRNQKKSRRKRKNDKRHTRKYL
jgi:hypothetical protein